MLRKADETARVGPESKDVLGNSLTSLTPEERLVKLEQNQDRMAQMLMQIVGYMDQNKNVGGSPSPGGPAPGGFPAGLPIGEIVKAGLQMFNQPSAPQVDPFQMEMYKGMKDAFVEGFKSYIQTVNQNARIGAEVVKAIEKGSLKLETVAAAPTA